jgi:hypothetical protein
MHNLLDHSFLGICVIFVFSAVVISARWTYIILVMERWCFVQGPARQCNFYKGASGLVSFNSLESANIHKLNGRTI